MMISEKKNMYIVSMIMVFLLWIITLIFKLMNFMETISNVFMWVLGLVILAYIGNYKKIVKEKNTIQMFDCTVAIGFVTSIAYIACISFFFGRYFIRYL